MVAVTNGANIMEHITRAKIKLCVLLVSYKDNDKDYAQTKEFFSQAETQGLVEMKCLDQSQGLSHQDSSPIDRPVPGKPSLASIGGRKSI